MDITNLQNKIVCVEYPAIVKNPSRMIETLGGLNTISQTFQTNKQRLALRFRPQNVYDKPAFGDGNKTSGILFKIVFRRSKTSKDDPPQIQNISITGVINKIYKFNGICDFQYVPIMRNKFTNKPECYYDKLMPSGLVTPDWLTEDGNDTYFLPPITFSRVDSSNPQLFRKEQQKSTENDIDNGLIGKTRLRRQKHTQYLPFQLTDPLPTEPKPLTCDYLKLKFISTDEYNRVKDMFDKRPIMSKMVVAYETHITSEKLKYILPTLAYYFTTGPWRIMWVRFGYDPRKDFESRYYQQLDYRIRLNSGIKNQIDTKRYTSIHKPDRQRQKLATSMVFNETKKNEILYYPYFEEGRMPPSRQCIYQFCDIRIAKIQEMLDKIPTPRTGAVCNERTGWLPLGFDDQCREIMQQILQNLKQQKRIDNEDSSIADDDESDDEGIDGEDDADADVSIDQLDDISDNDIEME